MNRFWNNLMRPIIEKLNANYIVEIGSDTGLNTTNILEYCVDHDAHMTAIDPFPQFDIDEFKSRYGDKFEIYKELSLSRLPLLNDYDVILIDGDHNWYTVYNELKIIEKQFKGKKFPLIFLHDIGWPYARRDLYYNPETIPEQYRQPYKKLGMYPNKTSLKNDGGLNAHLHNAIYEKNPHNGVLRAVEDYIEESNLKFSFELIPAFFGLGILYTDNKEIKNIVKESIKSADLLNSLEEERVKLTIEYSESKGKNRSLETKNRSLETELQHLEGQILQQKEAHLSTIKDKDRNIRELNSQINNLKTSFYERDYLDNVGRPLTQRLISKFPSLYILFNRHNNGIKNALINIKAYRSIKQNNLFDIGYYLKNNEDIKLSGVDPLLHYMYHGFKEGRNPNSLFDGNYYVQTYSDVKNSKMNPLIHYSLYGIKEKRHLNNRLGEDLSLKKNLPEDCNNQEIHNKKGLINSVLDQSNNYDVSVIMPTYNREVIIERAINSVLNQTFHNYELIIVDDGSTDGTENLIYSEYGSYLKSGKIRYIKQENCGVGKARNRGLEEAKGEIIAYLDSDNYWLETYLETMVYALLKNNKNTAYAAMEINDYYRNKKFIRETKYERNQLLNSNFIDLNVFIHKKFLYDQLGGFNGSLKRLVDWDLILRYTKLNEPFFVNEVLAKYFLNSKLNNISNTVNLDDNRSKVHKLHNFERIERGLEKLRIGYVLWDFPSFSQTFVMNELRWLVENNYDVKVFYKIKPDKKAKLNFNVKAIQIKDEFDLIEKINEFNINMLHTHFVYPACTLLTYPAAKKTGIPFTVFAHAVDIFHHENDKRNNIKEISKSKECKRVFILGKFHYDYLVERGVPEEKLMFLRQATKYEIEKVDLDAPRFKRKIRNIITITRFVEKKGIDTLIEAAKILENEDLIFKIYGYGPLENDLKEQIKRLNLKNVTIEGSIKNEKVKKAYVNGDIFVLPCRIAHNGDMDGMPTVIFEAMAYGIPVITTNVSTIPEFVLNNYCGFTVNPDDPVALANKIKYVKDIDKKTLFTILKRAQKQVQESSSVKETIETMLDIWKNNKIDLFMVTYQKGQYKDLKTIKEILDRIFRHTTTPFDLTIVDNDSDEDFKEFILEYAKSRPNIRLIFLRENLLCGPASNVALNNMNNKFAIYICSNEGFILKHGWELKAINYMKNHENVGIAGTLAYSPSFYDAKTYKNQEFFEKFRNKEYILDKDNVKFKHVQGGVYILRKETYNQCGKFNPLLPQDYMDIEYSYYLESNGWKLGEISEWVSLTKKTQPNVYTYLDENTSALHPLNLEELNQISDKASKDCNICNERIIDNKCSVCSSDSSERAIYRLIGKTDKTYRSLKCTLLLKHNTIHKKLSNVFELNNKQYSERSINEPLEDILGKIENTDVLIININFDELNYENIFSMINKKLNREGLLILQLTDDELLNNLIKKILITQNFSIKNFDFKSKKLSNNEFLVAELDVYE